MPVINRIADYAPELAEWRRWLHRHPEIGFDLPVTAAYVADRLREIGVDEVHEGIAKTGIVAVIRGRGEGSVVALRADMDALPMPEQTGLPYASETPGRMHACGHDGHTVMLLGAARYLAETRNFAGTAVLLFQPAEEDGGGGEAMVREGVLDRFDVAEVYALHNAPGHPAGAFFTCPGPIMAAVDEFEVTVTGKGGHAAFPQDCVDPLIAAVAMIQAIQTIVSRNHQATEDLVISVTQIRAGSANNVIPDRAVFSGTVRTFAEEVRAMVELRLPELVAGISAAYGVTADCRWMPGYPATVNDPDRTAFAVEVAREVAGADAVLDDALREMGAEDFAYMLNVRPGAYLFLGQGDGPYCHHPEYDFNDAITPVGASYFARIVERALPI